MDVILLFGASRIMLALFLLWAQNALFDFPGATPLTLANRWDAQLYQAIARDGYYHSSTISDTQLLPLFPMLMRAAALVVPSYDWAGLIVSNLCLLGAMLALYRLALDETDDPTFARQTVVYLLIFPTSFYFAAAYSESLLVFTGAMAVLCARRRSWGWAIFWCALASASRTVGVLFVGYIGLEWARSYGWRLERIGSHAAWRGLWHGLRTDWLVLLLLPLGTLGLLVHARYFGDSYGNPFLFSETHLIYGNTPGVSFSRFLDEFFYTVLHVAQGMFPRFQEFTNYGLWLVAMAAVVPVWRRFGSELAAIALVLLIIPAVGTSGAYSRYALAAFPMFFGMATWARHPRVDRMLTIAFVALQAGLILTWMRGHYA